MAPSSIPQPAAILEMNFGTKAVQAGSHPDPYTGAVIEPLSLSTTFAQSEVGTPLGKYEYTRSSNPNRDSFQRALAALEGGEHCLAFSSGSAVTSVVLQSLPAGSHVISVADIYGGTYRLLTQVASTQGIRTTFSTSLESELESLIEPETRLIWIETPSNPLLQITDIAAVARVAHNHGILVLVDNTFASPYIQNPLKLGADYVMHSVTKYVNGHSDVLMGAIVFNSDEILEKLLFLQNAIGAVPSPFDCWLSHRGLKTLHLRIKSSSHNALTIAEFLVNHPQVLKVNYPGLLDHPCRDLVLAQHRNGLGGGMLSFRVKGGAEAAIKFCKSTQLFVLAESLGGVESLVELPAIMTHSSIDQKSREESGVTDDLVRLSCGIEDSEDLLRDVENALKMISNAG